jgi:hypothetical protein
LPWSAVIPTRSPARSKGQNGLADKGIKLGQQARKVDRVVAVAVQHVESLPDWRTRSRRRRLSRATRRAAT